MILTKDKVYNESGSKIKIFYLKQNQIFLKAPVHDNLLPQPAMRTKILKKYFLNKNI